MPLESQPLSPLALRPWWWKNRPWGLSDPLPSAVQNWGYAVRCLLQGSTDAAPSREGEGG